MSYSYFNELHPKGITVPKHGVSIQSFKTLLDTYKKSVEINDVFLEINKIVEDSTSVETTDMQERFELRESAVASVLVFLNLLIHRYQTSIFPIEADFCREYEKLFIKESNTGKVNFSASIRKNGEQIKNFVEMLPEVRYLRLSMFWAVAEKIDRLVRNYDVWWTPTINGLVRISENPNLYADEPEQSRNTHKNLFVEHESYFSRFGILPWQFDAEWQRNPYTIMSNAHTTHNWHNTTFPLDMSLISNILDTCIIAYPQAGTPFDQMVSDLADELRGHSYENRSVYNQYIGCNGISNEFLMSMHLHYKELADELNSVTPEAQNLLVAHSNRSILMQYGHVFNPMLPDVLVIKRPDYIMANV